MFRKKRVLRLETSVSEHAGVQIFEHKISGFKRSLNEELAEIFANFFGLLARPGEHAVIGFTPIFEKHWNRLATSDWTTLTCVPERYINKKLELGWIMGYAQTPQKFAEVYRFAWNNNFGEPVVVVIAPVNHNGSFFAANRYDAYPQNEKILTEFYHTVIGRYHDGEWMTVASTQYDADQLLDRLKESAPPGYQFC